MKNALLQSGFTSLPLLNCGKVRDIDGIGQYARVCLEMIGWNMQAPSLELPPEAAAKTGEKYRETLKQLTEKQT